MSAEVLLTERLRVLQAQVLEGGPSDTCSQQRHTLSLVGQVCGPSPECQLVVLNSSQVLNGKSAKCVFQNLDFLYFCNARILDNKLAYFLKFH